MRNKKLSLALAALLAMFAIATLMTATLAAAQTEKVLYNSTTQVLARRAQALSPLRVTELRRSKAGFWRFREGLPVLFVFWVGRRGGVL